MGAVLEYNSIVPPVRSLSVIKRRYGEHSPSFRVELAPPSALSSLSLSVSLVQGLHYECTRRKFSIPVICKHAACMDVVVVRR